jgi:indolepyruvate ferredoxin oxidoreductase beta subunit
MGDGRFAPENVEAAGRALAREFFALDLDGLARGNATMVSATMFGALAGAGLFPWDRAACDRVIGKDPASLAGFDAAFGAVQSASTTARTQLTTLPIIDPPLALPTSLADLPEPVARVAALGETRCTDYQDAAYGALYLARIRALVSATSAGDPVTRFALEEAAHRLATWMTYEDIPRVAELKTRPERFAAIRQDVGLQSGQILRVTEYLKPGGDEIAAMLPKRWGERVNRCLAAGKSLPFLARGINVTTSGVVGYATMRLLARFKKRRRGSLRFHDENAAIEAWLAVLGKILLVAPALAAAVAEMPRLRKGYGETYLRGRSNYDAIFQALVAGPLARGELPDAQRLRNAMSAAFAAPDGDALRQVLSAAT